MLPKDTPSRILLFLMVGLAFLTNQCQSSPVTMKPTGSLVISTPSPPFPPGLDIDGNFRKELESDVQLVKKLENVKPDIYSFKIHSDITYRYARTYVTSRVVNPGSDAQEITFRVVLPETAFISKFIMEIDGKPYEAYVKEKEEAKRVYTEAQSQGQSAGLVEVNSRNSNIFNVNVNIKSQSKINFNLTYEELLSRRLGKYEQAISITPDQITNVKDFLITINIEESQNLTLLRVPNLRNDVDSQQDIDGNNENAIIERPAGNKAIVTWKPSAKDQSQLAKQGLTGKFIVQYDIKRELDAGEVLVMNGYFVHFFAPENLEPLKKHVVFVLDVSGSMWGRRLEQLKEAMNKILADLSTDDYFNIFTFSGEVYLWSPDDKIVGTGHSNWAPPPFFGQKSTSSVNDLKKRQPYPATKENIAKAQAFIKSLVASGGTNIYESISQALNLTSTIKKARDAANSDSTTIGTVDVTTTVIPGTTEASIEANINILPENVESLLMFLTDGEPTVGVTSGSLIQSLIQKANQNLSIPIFSLAFGEGADFPFVRKLSLQNNGFARKIYEASDAALQLKGFYNEIASPLLSNVKFNYTTPESAYSVENVTLTTFPTVFGGTEIAVAGILVPKPSLIPTEDATNTEKPEETTTMISNDEILNDDTSLLQPTNQHYFDVDIGGSGRDGEVHFARPEIFTCIIPWGIPTIKPFPPRPTPPPTREDVFLERLWAYLTIKQLIEKDLAAQSTENEIVDEDIETMVAGPPISSSASIEEDSQSENKTVEATTLPSLNRTVPETPKQKALRLALKYRFVTPLTSLVVVKPNSSDVSNAESADGTRDTPDSLAVPQSLAGFQSKIAYVSGGNPNRNRVTGPSGAYYMQTVPVPLSMSHSSMPGRPFYGIPGPPGPPGMTNSYSKVKIAGYQPKPTIRPNTYFPTTFAPRPLSIVPDIDALDYEFESEEAEAATAKPTSTTFRTTTINSNTPVPSLAEKVTDVTSIPIESSTETTDSKNLTLDQLSWFNISNPFIQIQNGDVETTYEIIKESSAIVNATSCSINPTGNGLCVHLKDCINSEFLNNMEIYVKSYFCPIKLGNGTNAAGACCNKN